MGYNFLWATMVRYFFSKRQRLLTNEQFKKVLAERNRSIDELLILYVAKNQCRMPRLGISIGKKTGNAVVRNRIKRLIREVFRQNQHLLQQDVDYLCMISSKWTKKGERQSKAAIFKHFTYDRVCNSFLTLAKATQSQSR